MHSIIDDVAWVAIGLVVVAFLFLLGTMYILLDEGVRRLVRSLRKPAGAKAQTLASTSAGGASVGLEAAQRANRARKALHPPLVNPHQTGRYAIWHALRTRMREARSGNYWRLHDRHHKPADAKP